MTSLDATHHNLNSVPSESYDLGIVIVPKKKPDSVNLEHIKKFCKKVGVLREPFWLFRTL